MLQSDKLIRLIIIHRSLDGIEALAKVLKNNGYAVRIKQAEDTEDIEDFLKDKDTDFILCEQESEYTSLEEISDVIIRGHCDCSLLAIRDESSVESDTAAMLSGARDVITHTQPQRLCLILDRELQALNIRRSADIWEQAYRDSEKRSMVLLHTSRDAIAYVHDGMHIYANPSYLSLFGFKHIDDIEGLPIMDMVESKEHSKLKHALRSFKRDSGKLKKLEITALKHDKPMPVTMEFAHASYEEEPCTQVMVQDHSATLQLAAQVKKLKDKDQLTGLMTRKAFVDLLARFVKSNSANWGLLFIDLDNMIGIRETIGLVNLDEVTKQLAQMITYQAGEDATIARFSDHTFTVLCPAKNDKAITDKAEVIRHEIENFISDTGDNSVTTTCSIGATHLKYHKGNSNSAITMVERACAAVTSEGGNGVEFVNPLVDAEAENAQRKWAQRIHTALKENRFRLLYQPIASLHGNDRERYDVLLRMVNEKGDCISPNSFIEAAERFGLMAAIDRWVLANAINVAAHRQKAGVDCRLFVRISDASLTTEGLPEWIAGRLQHFNMSGDRIALAIREKDAVAKMRETTQFMESVKSLGCAMVLDQFKGDANGMHALGYLPVDYLKISPELIAKLPEDKEAVETIKLIAKEAEKHDRQTIATGVGEASVLAPLWQYGVSFIQGEFLQEPSDKMEFDFSDEMI